MRIETILCEGTDPAQEILHAAQDKSVDLLVIGTQGAQRIGKARSWIHSRAADSSGRMSDSHHRARSAPTRGAAALSEDCVCDGLLC